VRCIGQWAPIVGTGLAVLGSLYLLVAAHLKTLERNIESNEEDPKSPIAHSSYLVPGADAGQLSVHAPSNSTVINVGYRRKVASGLITVVTWFGTAADGRYDVSEFKHGRADDFPEIPGEEHRNIALRQIREQYNKTRDADGHVTPALHGHSRAGSFTSSIGSGLGVESSLMALRTREGKSPNLRYSSAGFLSPTTTQRPKNTTGISFDELEDISSLSTSKDETSRKYQETPKPPLPVHCYHSL
jgi:hypothetical protein